MEKSFFQFTHNRVLGTLILSLTAIALASYSHLTLERSQSSEMGPATITVSGEGEVLAVPDIGEFSFTVAAEGDDATEAQEASATTINAIIEYLSENGVEERDIKTQNYNLFPRYRFEERVCPAGSFCPPGDRVQDGFEVSQTVRVKVRTTDEAGALISGVGELGATNISSLRFTIDDEDALKSEAREAAIADAKLKAKRLADDLGVRLVRIVGYWENDGSQADMFSLRAEMAVDEAFGVTTAPSLPTGENSTVSNVSLTYEIR
ncbi:MAG: SIMPL domain-containing protein [Patescibacteria group bacterium]